MDTKKRDLVKKNYAATSFLQPPDGIYGFVADAVGNTASKMFVFH